MSISRNVGAIHKYLTRVVTSPVYNRMRDEIKHIMQKTGTLGDVMQSLVLKMEETGKTLLTPGVLFEELGFRYVGPVDGHDLPALVATLRNVQGLDGTRAWSTSSRRRARATRWRRRTPSCGTARRRSTRSAARCRRRRAAARLHERLRQGSRRARCCASGDGGHYCGHAQRHGHGHVRRRVSGEATSTSASPKGTASPSPPGLATEGIVPVAAIYSTFLQRAYDSIIHDVAIQNLPVVFAMDRAGLVGNDGPTHMGLYDIAYCSRCRT
jgi:1-deoxy-D-xylulose-5-phosphate synthase